MANYGDYTVDDQNYIYKTNTGTTTSPWATPTNFTPWTTDEYEYVQSIPPWTTHQAIYIAGEDIEIGQQVGMRSDGKVYYMHKDKMRGAAERLLEEDEVEELTLIGTALTTVKALEQISVSISSMSFTMNYTHLPNANSVFPATLTEGPTT